MLSAALSVLGLFVVGPGKIDARAMALLGRVEAHLRNVRSLSADCIYTRRYRPTGKREWTTLRQSVQVKVMRPNFARIDEDLTYRRGDAEKWSPRKPFKTIASDGKTAWNFDPDGKMYQKWASDPKGGSIRMAYIQPLESFFDPKASVTARIELLDKMGLLRSVRLLQGGIVRIVYDRAGSPEVVTERHTVGKDLIVHSLHVIDTKGSTATWDLAHVKVNAPLKPETFAYQPPQGSREGDRFVDVAPTPGVPIGSPAPDFTVEDRNGKPTRLSDFRGKIVVLDFWATWCGPCLQSFPQVNEIAKKYRDRNVAVLAVSVSDPASAFREWVDKHASYDAIAFAFDKGGLKGNGVDKRLYKGGGIPTVYVIDPEGKIAAYFLGYGGSEEGLEKAILRLIAAKQSPES